jgi:FkbM family methyltransferase
MGYKTNNKLFFKYKTKKLSFSLICEVGVFMPESSNVIGFINEDLKTLLIEPNNDSLKRIYTYFKNKNIVVYPYAIYDYNGTIKLVHRNASTFVKDLPSSPALVNDRYDINDNDTFDVECKLFSEIDNGEIDLLSVDTEGCEWYVLKNMISRPKIISLETHGKFYTNPFINDINSWINDNGYKIWYKTKSDTIFYKEDVLVLTLTEKIFLFFMEFYIRSRRLKKFFARR